MNLAIQNVRFTLFDRWGQPLRTQLCHNLVMTAGLDKLVNVYGGVVGHSVRPVEIAVGTGSTPPVSTDPGLEAEVFRRKIDRRIPLPQAIQFQMLIGLNEANGNTLAEAAVFTSSSSGNVCLARVLIIPTIAKTSSIQVTMTHQFNLAAV